MRLAIPILFFGLTAAIGASVKLEWTPTPDASVAGYNIYYGGASRAYTNQINAANNTNGSVYGLVCGETYYFAVTAYDASGVESDYSGEAVYIVPSLPTTNIVTVSVPVLSATNLNGPWSQEAVFQISYTNPPGSKFFRFGLAITQTNQ